MDKVKRQLRNLSLRKSIVLYLIIFIAIAALVSILATQMCRSTKERIADDYSQTGERYYLTNEAGERLGDGVLISNENIPYSQADDKKLMAISVIENISLPLSFSVCMLLAVFAFYRVKIKRPLALLDKASERIGDNDLDFSVAYDSKDEMGKLCASFEKMRYSLQKNNELMWRQMEQRKRLNAAFAHDLRTPLTVLKGYVEILQISEKQAATKETAITMRKHIDRLERYVDSMSNLQRIEDVVPHYSKISVSDYLPQLAQMSKLICDKAQKECDFKSGIADATILIDVEIFTQVMENLVSNATRYAENRVEIVIAGKHNTIRLTVSDDGNGFSAESMDKATEPYYTGETDKSNHFGLGLHICKLLCRNHGGDLIISNTENGGMATATFKTNDEP